MGISDVYSADDYMPFVTTTITLDIMQLLLEHSLLP